MTITTTDRLAGPFRGDNETTEWPFDFVVYDKSHLRVVLARDGQEYELIADSDYEIELNDDQQDNPGGFIRYPHPDMDPPGFPLTHQETLAITTVAPAVQTASFRSAGGFRPQTVEQRLDYLTVLVQQLMERMARVPEAGISDEHINMYLGTAVQRADRFLAFDGQGNPLFVNATSADPSLQDEFESIKESMEQLEGEFNQLVEQLAPLAEEVPELRSELDALQVSVGALQASVASLAGRMSDAEIAISALQSEVSNLVFEVAQIDAAVGSLSSSVSSLQSSVSSLQSSVSSLQSSVSSLQSSVSSLQSSVSALQSRLSDAEASIVDLQFGAPVAPQVTLDDPSAAAANTAAIQAALNVAAGKNRVYIPGRGVCWVNDTIVIPSNSYVFGDGPDITILRMVSTTPRENDLVRTGDAGDPRENIVLRDMTLDFNEARWTVTGGTGRRTVLSIINTKRMIVQRVNAYGGHSHGIDIAAPTTGRGQGVPTVYDPEGSQFVWLEDCYVRRCGDDNVTTHQSSDIWITRVRSEDTSGASVPGNSNCFEIDDGSRNVFMKDCFARNGNYGLQIKGHEDAPAPYNVQVDGMRIVNCWGGVEIRHTGWYSATQDVLYNTTTDHNNQTITFTGASPTARNLILNNISVIAPANLSGNAGVPGEAGYGLRLRSYENVIINNLLISDGTLDSGGDYAPVDPVITNLINIHGGARHITLRNTMVYGFKNHTFGATPPAAIVVGASVAGPIIFDGLTVIDGPTLVFGQREGAGLTVLDNYYLLGGHDEHMASVVILDGDARVGRGRIIGYGATSPYVREAPSHEIRRAGISTGDQPTEPQPFCSFVWEERETDLGLGEGIRFPMKARLKTGPAPGVDFEFGNIQFRKGSSNDSSMYMHYAVQLTPDSDGTPPRDVLTIDGFTGEAFLENGRILTVDDLSALEFDVAALEADVGLLQSSVGTLQNDISNLQGRMTSAENDISGLQGRMGSAESDISALESDVSDLAGPRYIVSNSSRTLELADAGHTLHSGAGNSPTLTIPPNSSVPFPIGTRIKLLRTGTGTTTVASGSGVSLYTREGRDTPVGSVTIPGNSSVRTCYLVKFATDLWALEDYLTPADLLSGAEYRRQAISSNDQPTEPQEFLSFVWEEGNQNLGVGEGIRLAMKANMVSGPAPGVDFEFGNIQFRKGSANDSSMYMIYAVQLTPDSAGTPPRDVLTIDGFTGEVIVDSLTEASDARLKSDLRVIEGALDKVRQLTGYTFSTANGVRSAGVIAQDVQRVLPEAVVERQDGMLTVGYGRLLGLLIEAIKELADRR